MLGLGYVGRKSLSVIKRGLWCSAREGEAVSHSMGLTKKWAEGKRDLGNFGERESVQREAKERMGRDVGLRGKRLG